MPIITRDLLRKRSEHNEGIIHTLEELTLHQEELEGINEVLGKTCRKLKILYLQNNIITKIENLHHCKDLEYLNLALNNISEISGLHRCEMLKKLDLTMNFIDFDVLEKSIAHLRGNIHLREMFLMGNPVAVNWGHYGKDEKDTKLASYVIAILPQLTNLDGLEITRSMQIKANQRLPDLQKELKVLSDQIRQEKAKVAEEVAEKERQEEEKKMKTIQMSKEMKKHILQRQDVKAKNTSTVPSKADLYDATCSVSETEYMRLKRTEELQKEAEYDSLDEISLSSDEEEIIEESEGDLLMVEKEEICERAENGQDKTTIESESSEEEEEEEEEEVVVEEEKVKIEYIDIEEYNENFEKEERLKEMGLEKAKPIKNKMDDLDKIVGKEKKEKKKKQKKNKDKAKEEKNYTHHKSKAIEEKVYTSNKAQDSDSPVIPRKPRRRPKSEWSLEEIQTYKREKKERIKKEKDAELIGHSVESRRDMYLEMAQQKKEKEDRQKEMMPRERNYDLEQEEAVEKIRGKEAQVYYKDKDGIERIRQCNEGKWEFILDDTSRQGYVTLDIAVQRHLDSSLIDVDVHPTYVSIIIKSKVLRLVLPGEVHVERSRARRSKTTGHLVIDMPFVDPDFNRVHIRTTKKHQDKLQSMDDEILNNLGKYNSQDENTRMQSKSGLTSTLNKLNNQEEKNKRKNKVGGASSKNSTSKTKIKAKHQSLMELMMTSCPSSSSTTATMTTTSCILSKENKSKEGNQKPEAAVSLNSITSQGRKNKRELQDLVGLNEVSTTVKKEQMVEEEEEEDEDEEKDKIVEERNKSNNVHEITTKNTTKTLQAPSIIPMDIGKEGIDMDILNEAIHMATSDEADGFVDDSEVPPLI